MSTTPRRETDRTGYADHTRAAEKLHAAVRGYQDLALDVRAAALANADLGPYAQQVATILDRHYEALTVQLGELADRAQAVADDYRRHLFTVVAS